MIKSKKILASVLSVILLFTMFTVPLGASAAAKPKLNKAKATITRKKSVKLTLKNAAASKVKWSTSSKSIATVSKGKVTGKKAGKATITAKYKGKKYKCKVTVKGRVINKNKTFSVAKGTSIIIKYSGITVKKWKSSNTSIATISSKGVIKGKKIGTVTISATDKYGDIYKCKVKVFDANDNPSASLKSYILNQGKKGSDANYYVYNDYTFNGTDYYASMKYNEKTNKFEFFTSNTFEIDYCLKIEIPYAGSSTYSLEYYGLKNGSMQFDSSAAVTPATYDINTNLNFNLSSGYLDDYKLQSFANVDFWNSLIIWSSMLEPAGLSIKSFGFTELDK